MYYDIYRNQLRTNGTQNNYILGGFLCRKYDSTVFWIVTTCILVYWQQRSEKHIYSIFCPEDGVWSFVRNIHTYVPDYKVNSYTYYARYIASEEKILVCLWFLIISCNFILKTGINRLLFKNVETNEKVNSDSGK